MLRVITCTRSLQYSLLRTSHKWLRRPSQSAREYSKGMQWKGASSFQFGEKSMEIETTIWSDIPNGRKVIVEQMLASEEINKSKRTILRVTVRDLNRNVNHLSNVIWSFEKEKLKQSSSVLLVHQFRIG